MLSYLASDTEAFVSLFLLDKKVKQVNSDIAIILSQPLQTDEKLGIVQETVEEGENTPPFRGGTPSFNELTREANRSPLSN